MEAPTSTLDFLTYLFQIAPALAVMGWANVVQWKRNGSLTDKIHERDIENLKTLEQMLSALKNLEQKGDYHFEQLRAHISERVENLKKNS